MKYGRCCLNGMAGFTFMEILIVIIIIAVLAAAAIPRFANQPERMKAAEAISIMSTIRRGLLAYFDENSAWPTNAMMANLGTAAATALPPTTIAGTLHIEFNTPKHGWTFRVVRNGTNSCDIIADNSGTSGLVQLDAVTGNWTGTLDYAASGQYYPYLPK